MIPTLAFCVTLVLAQAPSNHPRAFGPYIDRNARDQAFKRLDYDEQHKRMQWALEHPEAARRLQDGQLPGVDISPDDFEKLPPKLRGEIEPPP
jgi:hypothetical protein